MFAKKNSLTLGIRKKLSRESNKIAFIDDKKK